ncbi:MAG: hypothetical protein H6847_14545 [Hyphomonas sp.]|nr:hypothetical protein [Hyphomonas sp.]MCB9972726.1 hypothetical protein [Hyphomonas sp.]MCC0017510.1 hypothetical protein [Rhodobiaceae bacterium]
MARLFDAYIMVDWSAASKPATGSNSIWVGVLAKDARLKFHFTAANPPTRLNARDIIRDLTERLVKRGDRVLIGFDFSLGYPAGTAAALGLDTDGAPPWAAMHAYLASRMKDKPDNNSKARFAVAAGMNYTISKGPYPFWGAPPSEQASTLAAKKTPFTDDMPLPEFRLTEIALRESKQAQPKSNWQIYGNGSVGSQALTGIPHVHALRQAWPDARIWPFELAPGPLTDEELDGISIVIAEIYPSLLKVTPGPGETTDEAQVREIASHYASLDEKGRLGTAFSTGISPDGGKIAEITSEEGWILGV